MKKIIITTTLLLGTVFIYAQKAEPVRQVKEYTTSTEDPHNPLVNGIPYNQYKAQVQTEEKNSAAAEVKARKEAVTKKLEIQRKIENATSEQSVQEKK
ncbi:hypothetical protein [Kaistella antarctica]|uniref:Uncharacterized protein n=1 Tax=Kaistella antarctica TaxID=266748 RepID=A0A3S5EUP7_9FLAO|nr:hypothetical protein [Kaistella antarctica]KEY19326.1 hypothetical protein HY04_13045 [Kaistella antarctica]SEW05576.1 hypothetical protein SAMN05421765_2046 [Kaistella antarctica]VEH98434.1 Uncharacterised protein [Kaistella antarctica]